MDLSGRRRAVSWLMRFGDPLKPAVRRALQTLTVAATLAVPVLSPAQDVSTRSARPLAPLAEINDRDIQRRLLRAGQKLLSDGTAVRATNLIAQLSRKSCSVQLRPSSDARITPMEIVARRQPGVLVVASLYKCDKCSRRHVGGGTGYMLHESGVFATACHVVNEPRNETLLIMTGDGRIAPVVEVLAANRRTDVAILKAAGEGFPALALSTNAPVGSPIWVLSHPDDNFYSLSAGMVSRYFISGQARNRPGFTTMAVTADFAKGSSGGPVFNDRGDVVGMVTTTLSSYFVEPEGHQEDLQMVFKYCVPAKHIIELFKPD